MLCSLGPKYDSVAHERSPLKRGAQTKTSHTRPKTQSMTSQADAAPTPTIRFIQKKRSIVDVYDIEDIVLDNADDDDDDAAIEPPMLY